MAKNRAKQIFRIVLLISTAISLYFVPWTIVFAYLKPLPDTVQEQVTEALDHGFDGIIVYVDQADQPSQLYAAGYKNREKKIPADPNALFKIASINKLYTALAITKLVHDEQLSLEKTVGDYFPELVDRIEYADKITVRMLIEHRSGIPNYTDTYMYWADPKETYEENLALILDQPAMFEPGEDYQYCNTNYMLLGELMNKTLGYDHFEFIRQEILIPNGLNNTFGSNSEVNMDDVMSGYYVGYEADLKTQNLGMLATAEDVGKFLHGLNDGSIFEDGEQAIYSSIYRYEHTGLVPGYQSIAKYHEDIDTVVIQFTNTTDFEGYNWNLSEIVYNRIVKILRNK